MISSSLPLSIWADHRIMLRKSPIHCIGSFATEDIPAGQSLVIVSGGIVYTSSNWREGKVQLEGDLYNEESLGDDTFIATPKLFHYYINHCCEPNALNLAHSKTTIHYVAWRPIAAGEEITTDVGLYTDAEIEHCRCGAASCRGHITPADQQLPELQQRYQQALPWRFPAG